MAQSLPSSPSSAAAQGTTTTKTRTMPARVTTILTDQEPPKPTSDKDAADQADGKPKGILIKPDSPPRSPNSRPTVRFSDADIDFDIRRLNPKLYEPKDEDEVRQLRSTIKQFLTQKDQQVSPETLESFWQLMGYAEATLGDERNGSLEQQLQAVKEEMIRMDAMLEMCQTMNLPNEFAFQTFKKRTKGRAVVDEKELDRFMQTSLKRHRNEAVGLMTELVGYLGDTETMAKKRFSFKNPPAWWDIPSHHKPTAERRHVGGGARRVTTAQQ